MNFLNVSKSWISPTRVASKHAGHSGERVFGTHKLMNSAG